MLNNCNSSLIASPVIVYLDIQYGQAVVDMQ